MKISEICNLLEAKVICGKDKLDTEVFSACGSDMMSDVLAYVKDHSVLLTGLVNPQVVRTAEMMDMGCIIFVRGKQPTEAIIELACESNIVLMTTNYRMYTSCGILYNAGLKSATVDVV